MSDLPASEKPQRGRWGFIDWVLLAVVLLCIGLLLQRTVFTRHPPAGEDMPLRPVTITRAEPPANYPDIDVSAAWLSEHLHDPDLRVLDARSRSAYIEGHLPGAVSIPARECETSVRLGRSFAEKGLSDSTRLVCYGEDCYSADAARLLWLLDVAGAADARVLDGGISAWVRGGGAIETVEDRFPNGMWGGGPRLERLATHEYVMKRFGRRGVEIIDARGEEQWEGTSPSGKSDTGVKSGHIPHSLPFDFRVFLEGGRTLLDPGETWSIFAQLGPRPTDPVDLNSEFIVYGDGLSGDGALAYFLLRRAGLERVRYYDRGWADWSKDPTTPVVSVVGAESVTERLKAENNRCIKKDLPPEGFVLLDVRGRSDYDVGHIPGAVALPTHVFTDSLDAVLSAIWPDADRAQLPVVVYCYDSGCIRSRNCATIAAQKGFQHVEWFRGGVGEWKHSGGKLKRGG